MVQRAFTAAVDFFGTLAKSFGGLGAVCTAAGFLAERTRWSMLGFGDVPIDFDQYLLTGARFLGFLPGILLATGLRVLAGSATLLLLALAAALAVPVVRWLVRRRGSGAGRRTVVAWLGRRRGALVGAGLLLLLLFQFSACLFLFQGSLVRNVLFVDPGHWGEASCGDPLPLAAEIRLGCTERLNDRMGRVFLAVIASGGILWGLARAAGEDAEPGEGTPAPLPVGRSLLVGANAALLVVQVLLLPMNYGILFVPNEFPVVEVELEDEAGRSGGWPAAGRLSLIQRRDDDLYLYASRPGRIWVVPSDDVRSLIYLGSCGVFDPLDRCLPSGGPP